MYDKKKSYACNAHLNMAKDYCYIISLLQTIDTDNFEIFMNFEILKIFFEFFIQTLIELI